MAYFPDNGFELGPRSDVATTASGKGGKSASRLVASRMGRSFSSLVLNNSGKSLALVPFFDETIGLHVDFECRVQ
jgi:hypothetical protein